MRSRLALAIFAALALAGCAADPHSLRTTSSDDPVWQLNPGKWVATMNDLVPVPIVESRR